jgi:hypothetical protein
LLLRIDRPQILDNLEFAGDEIALRQDLSRTDMGNKSELGEVLVRAITRNFAGLPAAELAQTVERGLAEAMQVSVPILSGHCEVAQRIAQRIGLSDEVRENLGQLYERWDGRGLPRGLSGNAVKLPVRLVTLAQDAIALIEAHGARMTAALEASARWLHWAATRKLWLHWSCVITSGSMAAAITVMPAAMTYPLRPAF